MSPFVRLYADTRPFRHHIDHNKVSSAGQNTISQTTLAQAKMRLAPLPEQHRIVEAIESYLTRLDDAVASLERVQRNLKRYRASVLKAAVEGRLVPTEAELARTEGRDYEPASVLLERILKERRHRWIEDAAEKGRAKAEEKAKKAGKPWTKKDNAKTLEAERAKAAKKYKEPAAPDTGGLQELREGWCWATWDRLAGRVTVGHVGRMTDEYRENGIPFLRGQNVKENRYEPSGLKFIDEHFHQRLKKSALTPGDLLIVRSGNVGTACVLPEHIAVANCSDLVIVKQPKIRPRFGAFYMNSLAKASVKAQQVGIALTHFNTKSAAALAVPVPPLNEQDRIVLEADQLLSKIDEVESEVHLNLTRCQRLRQSILKWAFEGKLVDQDPNDEPASVLLERIQAERTAMEATDTKKKGRKRRSK